MRVPCVSLAALCAALCFVPVASAGSRPDGAVTHTFDLTRSPDKPLALVLKLREGMWQFGDRRKLDRIESDVALSTSWLYSRDSGANGWLAQGFLALHDLRAHTTPRVIHGRTHATKPRRRSRKVPPAPFLRYLAGLPAQYEKAGYRVAVPPHAPHALKNLRAGRERVELWYSDLGITRRDGESSVHEYRTSVFGFVVHDWLVTLRVRQLGTDLSSLFIDGLSLTVRKAKASRDVKFTAVGTDRLETRSAFKLPKGYARSQPGAPGSAPHQRMALWERFEGDQRVGRVTFDVVDTAFEPTRDIAAWQGQHPWAKTTLAHRKARGKRVAHAYAHGRTELDGKPASTHAVVWHAGSHRYVLRVDILDAGTKRAMQAGRRAIDGMVDSLRSWRTRPLSTR